MEDQRLVKPLCLKYTNLKEMDIILLENMAAQLHMTAALTNTDVFIDALTRNGEDAIVLAWAHSERSDSLYGKSVVGELAYASHEPAVWQAFKTNERVYSIRGVSQEGVPIEQTVVPIPNDVGDTIGVLIMEKDISEQIKQEEKMKVLSQTANRLTQTLRSLSTSAGRMKPLSILLVEDEALIRLDMREMLTEAGHIICGECGNGIDAIQLAKQLQPELVIMDITMPGLNGFETAKAMHGYNIPVVMVTGNSQPKMIQRAENVHVYGYVIKPVAEKNLLATIQIAYARWKEFCEVNKALDETKTALENQKLISHARSIIQDKLGISAQVAHQKMLQESMKYQITVAAVAKKIIEKIKK